MLCHHGVTMETVTSCMTDYIKPAVSHKVTLLNTMNKAESIHTLIQ